MKKFQAVDYHNFRWRQVCMKPRSRRATPKSRYDRRYLEDFGVRGGARVFATFRRVFSLAESLRDDQADSGKAPATIRAAAEAAVDGGWRARTCFVVQRRLDLRI